MGKKSKESEYCPTTLVVDRICQLPDNVIDNILTSMTIVEAARTSALSRTWRRGWRNISVLIFDSSFGKKFEEAGLPNLMMAIYKILLLHLGAIDGFTLSFPWLESCAEIDPLIQFLSEKKVQHLKIHFKISGLHILPSYLFSCFQLSTLDLTLCEFSPPPNFGGFSQLTTLVLKYVYINEDFFGMLFSNCPLLQHVKLRKCCFGEVSSINIIAPNLQTFLYECRKLIIYFVSAPLLDQLDLVETDGEFDRHRNFDGLQKLQLDEFCTAVPALMILNINDVFLKFLEARHLSSQPPNCFQQLKELNVYHICLTDLGEVSPLLGLIRRSPNLERFSTRMLDCDSEGLVPNSFFKIYEPDQYDVSCNRLQTVELFDFHGTDPEMEFVKFLLSKSPQLKMMTIHQASKDNQKGMQILRKMIRFQRASAIVDINFCDACLDHSI